MTGNQHDTSPSKAEQSDQQVNPVLDITNYLIFEALYGIFMAEVIRK